MVGFFFIYSFYTEQKTLFYMDIGGKNNDTRKVKAVIRTKSDNTRGI